MRSRLAYAAFGILATAVGMATGHFVASLLHPDSSPVLAVGSTVIDHTPTAMKDWAIRHFGTNDKLVLVGSVLVGVVVLAAIAGLLARKRLAYGQALVVVLVLVAGGAVLTRPTVQGVDISPTIFTLLVGVTALWLLDRVARVRAVSASEDPPGAPVDVERPGPSRRGVLVTAGILAAAAAVLGGAGRLVNQLKAKPEAVALPAPASPAPVFPTGLDRQVPGITPLRTAVGDFYRVDTRLDTPVVDSGGWTLSVDGDVSNKLEISFDELLAMPMIERDITLTCVSNSVGGQYVGGARWLGVPLKTVLDRAGVGAKADQILTTDFDGMTISTPLDIATDGRDAMLAVGMNGEQLAREHGFPVRMIVPGLYGFISATKWITKITLTTYADEQAYWTKKKWATDAPIKPSARIDTPRALARLQAGDNVIGGVAWAQNDGGPKTVQVQIDHGPWQDATLGPDVDNVYWRQWFYKWQAPAGSHQVSARVIDGQGDVQTAARAIPFPEGASGIHSLLVTVA